MDEGDGLGRRLGRGLERVPWWGAAMLGVLCVAVGLVLLVRPFRSLTVLLIVVAIAAGATGVTAVAEAGRSPRRWMGLAVGGLWLVLAVVIVAVPALSLSLLSVFVGAALVVEGILSITGALRERSDARVAAVLQGVAGIVFGVLALAWPDVTLLVVAVVFGAKTVLFGCSTLFAAVRRARGTSAPERSRKRSRWVRTVGAALSLLLAVALALVSAAVHRGEPSVTAFYTPPSSVPDRSGQLLRSEAFDRDVPAGAVGWRILYTTSRDDGRPAVASGIVLAPRSGPGARPVVAWAHGTTGVDTTCAPSLLKHPFTAGALPALDGVLEAGWALVATDYVGLGTEGPHPYLIGRGEARSVLDAVRAARQLDTVDLSDETVVWGHSQGGHAALWTGQIADSYAPDVPLAGVAALAPASDLTALVSNLDTVPGGAIFASYVFAGYRDHYPDVTAAGYLRPAARVLVREWEDRCLAEPEVFVSIASSLMIDKPVFSRSPVTGAFGTRLRENTPRGRIPAPVLIAQGETDQLVLPAVQRAYAEAACAAGNRVDYRTYPGLDHTGVVGNDSPLLPQLLAWTADRFQGRPAPTTCPSRP
ncbi:lipase family protein [Streptomyces sp. NPDC013740]|uniref:lipase family protein n=1 Tax=Streptomyces sp. NPDC013740 TaxID=3364867 RepID=UPI0036F7006E